jgi:hypothetical protein
MLLDTCKQFQFTKVINMKLYANTLEDWPSIISSKSEVLL